MKTTAITLDHGEVIAISEDETYNVTPTLTVAAATSVVHLNLSKADRLKLIRLLQGEEKP